MSISQPAQYIKEHAHNGSLLAVDSYLATKKAREGGIDGLGHRWDLLRTTMTCRGVQQGRPPGWSETEENTRREGGIVSDRRETNEQSVHMMAFLPQIWPHMLVCGSYRPIRRPDGIRRHPLATNGGGAVITACRGQECNYGCMRCAASVGTKT